MTSKKRSPDLKVVQGGLIGSVVGAISSIFMIVFHQHLPISVLSTLPALLGVLGHFMGSYMAPYEPRVEETIAYVQKVLSEITPAK